MSREEAIKILKFQRGYFCDLKGCEEHQAFTMAIKALEQVSCDDAISREAVLNEIYNTDGISNIYFCLADKINALPSVKPTVKVGHWEWVQYGGICGNWHCSECRTIIPHMPENTDNTPIYKWCPMCGVKMASPTGAEREG